VKRQLLLNSLEAYKPTDAAEIVFKQQMIEFIDEHPDCFERTLLQGHITASAWIVSADGERALLMHHTKLDKWFQLGGHCDGDPDTLSVALKEAHEESGIAHIVPVSTRIFDIDIHLIPANSKDPEHYHYDVRYLLQVSGSEHYVRNNESKELRWIGKDRSALPTQSSSMIRMFEKWMAYDFLPSNRKPLSTAAIR
jgi:8-oxo-dGTP pyrophosphatase MutT (NUDIX family)